MLVFVVCICLIDSVSYDMKVEMYDVKVDFFYMLHVISWQNNIFVNENVLIVSYYNIEIT